MIDACLIAIDVAIELTTLYNKDDKDHNEL